MAAETDFSALSLQDRLTHKVWKARLSAYEELVKQLQSSCDEDALAEWKQYVSQAVADPNVPAQLQGLEFALVWLENAPKRLVPVSDIAQAIVAKGLNASKTQTKEKVQELCLLLIEVGEQPEAVIEALAGACSAKQPKVVATAASLLTSCLEAFGAKVINPKLFLKKTVGVLGHTNKMAREEGKNLVTEMHRWLGDAIKPSLSDIKPVMMKELEDEWAKQEGVKPKPTRRLRSAAKKAAAAAQQQGDAADGSDANINNDDNGDGDDDDDDDEEEVDAYELADAVNALSKIPKSFESDLKESKWSIRRDALQSALTALSAVKLADGDYGDLVRLFIRVVANDSNVINVALATDCIGAIASGLRDRFSPYAPLVFESMLDKFKEKKLNVVTALHKAVPAVLAQMPTDKAVETLVASIKQKNPLQMQHTAKVVSESLSRLSKKPLGKSHVSSLAAALVACLTAREPAVRESAATALSALIAHSGEKFVRPQLADVDKKKADKIIANASSVGASPSSSSTSTAPWSSKAAGTKKAAAKKSSSAGASNGRPKASRASSASSSSSSSVAASKAGRPKRTKAAGVKKSTARKSVAASKKGSSGSKKVADSVEPVSFPEMSPDAAEAAVQALVSGGAIELMKSSAWKEKLEGATALKAALDKEDSVDASTAMAIFAFAETRTRQWKETNFQVMGAYIEALSAAASKASPSCPDRAVDMIVPPLVDKLADVKLRAPASDALLVMCEQLGPNFVVLRMCSHASSHRSPKVHTETCNTIASILNAFGMQLSAKAVVTFARKMLASTNAGVRTAAIDMLGTLRIFVGPSLISLFQDEKPALLQLITEKFDKVSGEKAPAASRHVRGAKKSSSSSNAGDDDDDDDNDDDDGAGADDNDNDDAGAEEDEDDEDDDAQEPDDDVLPREKLSDHVPADVITSIGDKSWKVRNEGLQQLGDILKRHQRLTPDLGDVLIALKARLSDSNKNLIIITLHHLTAIGAAMGAKGCRQNLNHILPEVLQNLADNKDAVRTAVTDVLTTWRKYAGIGPFFEGDAVASCLASGKPNAQAGILTWMSEQLSAIKNPKKLPPLKTIVKPVMQCLQHRNPAVRKAAQGIVPEVARSIGIDRMRKLAGTLPSSAKDVVVGMLDAMPAGSDSTAAAGGNGKKAGGKKSKAAAAPKAKKQAGSDASSDDDSSATAKPTKAKRGASKPDASKGKKTSSSSVASTAAAAGASSTLPLGADPKKQQRIRDDKAHKSLKWNFTTPREEYVQQLQNQLKPIVSKELLTQLFSDDFKDHCKAIDVLHKAVSKRGSTPAPQAEEAVASLDLLLMWVTLRFFETNPRTQLKAMTFLKNLFETVVDQGYSMSDYEAASFVPYLIQKLGDKMENIREDTHAVLRTLPQVYTGNRLFSYLLDGLKSKNARQRTGCLVAMNHMLSKSGMTVLEQIGAPKALKTVTKQVADRDHSVRSAALDFLVTAHNIQGDGIYKLMGSVPDKSMSLITERVKRMAKSRGGSSASVTANAKGVDAGSGRPKSSKSSVAAASSSNDTTRSASAASLKPSVAQEFSLDLDSLNLPAATEMKMPELAPTEIDEAAPATYPQQQQQQPQQQPQQQQHASSANASMVAMHQPPAQQPVITPAATLPQQPTVTLEDIIDHISSTDMRQAVHALKMAEDLVKDKDINMLSSVGSLVTACTLQLRLVFTVHAVRAQEVSSPGKRPEAVRLCKHVLSCIMHVYEGRAFARSVPDHVQQQLLVELVSRLLDEKIEQWQDGAHISRALNMILLRILENSRRDVTFAVLIRVLNDACAEKMVVPHRFTELIMKCLWKLTKTLAEHLSEINVAQLLREIHEFLVAHPPVEWKKRSNDMPLRTMKTILNSLVKALGSSVMTHLSLIGQSPLDTAVGSYVLLMLKRDGHTDEQLKALLPTTSEIRQHQQQHQQQQQQDEEEGVSSSFVVSPSERVNTTVDATATGVSPNITVDAPTSASSSGLPKPSSSLRASTGIPAAKPSAVSSLSARLARAKSKMASRDSTSVASSHAGEADDEGAHGLGSLRSGSHLGVDPRHTLRDRFDSVAEFVAMEAQTQARRTDSTAALSRQQTAAPTIADDEARERIHAILARVTAKDTTRQGLRELKEFKEQHPEVDVMSHCQHLSSYMQSYIQRRLDEVDVTSSVVSSSVGAPASTAVSYWERLRALQSQVSSGGDGDTSAMDVSTSIARAPVQQEFNLPEVAPVDTRMPLQRKDNEQQDGTQQKSLASLKARLAKLKQGQASH
ncbi:hypothetical protein PTSG_03479 [Salpingoeca rosetta]|uniref:TOG domain-containing protein n=1 Tax=Salpingoeca rosetta (strain ATCC 50818 / BSB-021) TaxID=946362 RepID=F2U5Q6_SALR5|nr:uncharacterized protein PTSG_03479 [Salpingoeca rosetta]EGD82847.1 hypothetical protein PTSG_03479 [Salpingoeca rosetta]|eukprot:XP_004995211.1 hypothetical protein PTSG_03479 [Salpingoeca rosetta]